jgi:hypothetical protein
MKIGMVLQTKLCPRKYFEVSSQENFLLLLVGADLLHILVELLGTETKIQNDSNSNQNCIKRKF